MFELTRLMDKIPRPTDLTDAEWAELEPLIASVRTRSQRGPVQRSPELRRVVDWYLFKEWSLIPELRVPADFGVRRTTGQQLIGMMLSATPKLREFAARRGQITDPPWMWPQYRLPESLETLKAPEDVPIEIELPAAIVPANVEPQPPIGKSWARAEALRLVKGME